MYMIVSEGVNIAICETPRYIKLNPDTGAYIECEKDDAIGIAANGVAYNVVGGTAILDAPEAVAVEVDLGNNMFDLIKRNAELEEQNAMLTECILEMSEIVYA